MLDRLAPRELVAVAPTIGRDEPTLELVVATWLDAKIKRTGSAKTGRAYRDAIDSFRTSLQVQGGDLDADDTRAVSLMAQAWAGRAKPDGTAVSANTYNQRLAILASFYTFGIKRGLLSCGHPITVLDRRPTEAYAGARALDFTEVAERMAAIDRTQLAGKRDYALLALGLQTGRRLAELAGLRWQHLLLRSGRSPTILVTWPRTKGDKHMADELTPALSAILLDWLGTLYGADAVKANTLDSETPVWISLAHNSRGHALTPRAIEDLCAARLGTSHVHALRHTFAHGMEEVGAKASDIQARLGHSSLAVTGIYLASLRKAENAHASELADLLGLTGKAKRRTR